MVHGCEILRQLVGGSYDYSIYPIIYRRSTSTVPDFFPHAENARCVALAVPWCLGSFGGLGHEMTWNDGTRDVAEK